MPRAELAGTTLVRRYVHGPGTDEPIVWYEGAGTTDRRFLMADERGSIVSVTNASGAILAINSYDEYGIPGSGNIGRFQYTGQMWLPEVGLYHYKARMYSPTLGRFMQSDPIGYADGLNWYAYVGNDPVNFVDPLGLNREVCGLQDRTYAVWEWVPGEGFVSTTVVSSHSVCYDLPDDERSGPGHNGSGGDTAQDPCAGYSLFDAARDTIGAVGDGAGALEDLLSRTPAAILPQAQGFMKALRAIQAVGLGGNVAISLYMGYRYGDWLGTVESVTSALAGSIAARAYKGMADIVEPSRNNDLVADLLANIIPHGVSLGSSGPCANE